MIFQKGNAIVAVFGRQTLGVITAEATSKTTGKKRFEVHLAAPQGLVDQWRKQQGMEEAVPNLAIRLVFENLEGLDLLRQTLDEIRHYVVQNKPTA